KNHTYEPRDADPSSLISKKLAGVKEKTKPPPIYSFVGQGFSKTRQFCQEGALRVIAGVAKQSCSNVALRPPITLAGYDVSSHVCRDKKIT
ncbi:hypothetical protein COS16_02210, partial [Candidatus Desantisbacteria bacterium CG02_land_8_20_14_3_00_49_13]